MKVKRENICVEFDEPPKIESRKDAIKILNLLIKADGAINEIFALKALKVAIRRGLV